MGVTREQAIAHAELARDIIISEAATKADLKALKLEIDGSLRELKLRMTVKLGAVTVAVVALVSAVQKLL